MSQRIWTAGWPSAQVEMSYAYRVHEVSLTDPPVWSHTLVHVEPSVLISMPAWSYEELSTPSQR